MKNHIIIVSSFLLWLSLSIEINAQTRSLGEMKESLVRAKHDSTRSMILMNYGFDQFGVAADSVLKYTKLGLNLAEKIGFQKGIVLSYRNYGVLYHYQSEIDSALFYFTKFLESSKKINYQAGVSRAYNNLGILHALLSNYVQAIGYYEESLEISVQLGDTLGIARTMNNMGEAFQEIGDYNRALNYLIRCSELEKKMGLENEKTESLKNIGHVLIDLNQYQSAMDYFQKALTIDSSLNRVLRVAQTYRDIGRTHQFLNNQAEALKYLEMSLDRLRKFGYLPSTAEVLLNIGDLYVTQQQHKKAFENYNEALHIFSGVGNRLGSVKAKNKVADIHLHLENYPYALEMAHASLTQAMSSGFKREIVLATNVLYQAYDQLGDHKKAYKYRSMNAQYSDSLYGEFRTNMLTTFENRYKLDQIHKENIVLAHQNELNQAQLDKAKLQIQKKNILLIGGSVSLILLTFLTISTLRFTKERKKSFALLRKKNKEIIQINEELEERVKKRTKKIKSQNKRLQEYAFFNSHLVRAPLANILGYTQYLSDNNNDQDWKELNQNIFHSAKELDQVVRSIGEILDDEELNS